MFVGSTSAPHPLKRVLGEAVVGRFPPADTQAEVVPPGDNGQEAVLALTAHAFIATSLPAENVGFRKIDGLGRAMEPDFLRWLAGPGGYVGSHDVVLGRLATGGDVALRRSDGLEMHERVRLAKSRRQDVAVFEDPAGLVTVGRNAFGWLEVSVEVVPKERSKGNGRRLIVEAVRIPASGEPLFAHVATGNAASLRAFLAAGFHPLGSIVMIRPVSDRRG